MAYYYICTIVYADGRKERCEGQRMYAGGILTDEFKKLVRRIGKGRFDSSIIDVRWDYES